MRYPATFFPPLTFSYLLKFLLYNYIVKDIRNRAAVVRSTFAKHSPKGHSLLCNIRLRH
jgi:hypothetical protein